MTKKPQSTLKKTTKESKTSNYSYQTKAPQITNQVIKHPLTDSDLGLLSKFYKSFQNRLRGLAIVSLTFAIINTFVLSDIIMDWTVSVILYLVMFFLGVLAIVVSLNMLQVRSRISNTLKEGTAIEVWAPAYRNRTARNAVGWTVGPISIMPTPETSNMIQEGAQVRVLCMPKLKIALSINDIGVKYGARIMFPPNLEAMATNEQISPQYVDSKEEINEVEEFIDKSMNSDERLTKLKELKDKGLITEKDYENKKKEILIDI
jgi:hypothetical protein